MPRWLCPFARAGQQRELADDKNAASDIDDGKIHPSALVGKKFLPRDFSGQPRDVVSGVIRRNSDKNQQTASDGPGNSAVH